MLNFKQISIVLLIEAIVMLGLFFFVLEPSRVFYFNFYRYFCLIFSVLLIPVSLGVYKKQKWAYYLFFVLVLALFLEIFVFFAYASLKSFRYAFYFLFEKRELFLLVLNGFIFFSLRRNLIYNKENGDFQNQDIVEAKDGTGKSLVFYSMVFIVGYFVIAFLVSYIFEIFDSGSGTGIFFYSIGDFVFSFSLLILPLAFLIFSIIIVIRNKRKKLKNFFLLNLLSIVALLLLFPTFVFAWSGSIYFSLIKKTPDFIRCSAINVKDFKVDQYEKNKCFLRSAVLKQNEKKCNGIEDIWYDVRSAQYFSDLSYDSMKRNCFGEIAYAKNDANICNNYEEPTKCVDYVNYKRGVELNEQACNQIIDEELKSFCKSTALIDLCKEIEYTDKKARKECWLEIIEEAKDIKICNSDLSYRSNISSYWNDYSYECFLKLNNSVSNIDEFCNKSMENDSLVDDCFFGFAQVNQNDNLCEKITSSHDKEMCYYYLAIKTRNSDLCTKYEMTRTWKTRCLNETIDSDNDGLSDKEEIELNTNPNNPDTDGDGFLDGEEVKNGHNPVIDFETEELLIQK